MAPERVTVRDRAAFLRRADHRLLRVAALGGLLVLWEALTRTGWIPALFLPSPLGVVRELGEMAASGQLTIHIAASLRRLVLGFGAGAGAGIIVGIATGVFSRAEAVGQPLIAATFPIPKIALLPLLILWLGIGEPSKIAVIALGVFFPMAAIEALKGGQVDAILLPQPFPGTGEAQGFGKILFWAGDLHPWQTVAVFYSKKFAADRKRAAAFMRGYLKASRYYYDAVLVQKDGRPAPGANYDEAVRTTAKYTDARPEVIRLGFPFQDRNARLLVTDIERQMKWWTANGFMRRTIRLKGIVDTSFVEEAVKAAPEK